MEEGEPIRIATLDEYKKTPQFVDKEEEQKALPPKLTLYPDYRYEGYKWGMTIDLNACVGLRIVHDGLPIGEQHRGGGQDRSHSRAAHELAARGSLFQGQLGQSGAVLSAGAVHAVRERAVRIGLPGGRDGA